MCHFVLCSVGCHFTASATKFATFGTLCKSYRRKFCKNFVGGGFRNFVAPNQYNLVIYGTRDITHIKNDGKWLDITSSIFSEFHASATFNPDGTYSGHGYFGNGSGTYKAMDNAIICYVGKEEYARYIIHNLTNDTAEMTMKMGGSSIDIKCKKR